MENKCKALMATAIVACGLYSHARAATNYTLPLQLAVEAAGEAVRACEASGYHISVAVLDLNGQVKVSMKGDDSTIHTKDTAFGKAYTLVTLGPVFKLDTSTDVANLMKDSPHKPAFLTVPGITPLPGAVAIKADGQIVAAIGVGGAPGGDKDEACARAGALKIADKLPGGSAN